MDFSGAVDTKVTIQDIEAAKGVINTYRTTCDGLFVKLTNVITSLQASGYIGMASEGYTTFVNEVKPALTTQLTGTEESVTALLDSLLQAVRGSLLGQVDPDLKTNNENAI